MQLGMIGLGRMGANMTRRLLAGGHRCVVFNRSPKAVEELTRENAVGASSHVWRHPHRRRHLAIPSTMFGVVVEQLSRSGCMNGARVIIEKHFGRDLACVPFRTVAFTRLASSRE